MKKKYYWIIGIIIAIILIAYYVIFYSEFSSFRTFCLQNEDCKGTCTCDCINKHMYCYEEILCEIGPRACECVSNKCVFA